MSDRQGTDGPRELECADLLMSTGQIVRLLESGRLGWGTPFSDEESAAQRMQHADLPDAAWAHFLLKLSNKR